MRLVIKRDPRKGRGVYAGEKIRKGQTIEICQLIILNTNEISESLDGYVFSYSRSKVAVALGNGSLYNHSDDANAECYFDKERNILIFDALRTIQKGEEITINYGYSEEEKEQFNIS